MAKSTVAFLWWENEVNWEKGEMPFEKKWKSDDYAKYTEMLRKKDIEVICGDYRWYDNGEMQKAWQWKNNEWIKIENKQIDGVYDLFRHDNEKMSVKKKMDEDISILNHPEVTELCQDKLKTFRKFLELLPETKKANKENVDDLLDKNSRIIVKPRYGSQGEKVEQIESLEEFEQLDSKEDMIAQEFVETKGIPKLGVEGLHDLRILIVNDEIVGSYLRLPKEGSILSNVAEGGTKKYVKKEDIPDEALKRSKTVAERMEEHRPVIYTVDYMFDEKMNPLVIELNSQPGVYYHGPGREKEWEYPWMKKIVNAIEEMTKQ